MFARRRPESEPSLASGEPDAGGPAGPDAEPRSPGDPSATPPPEDPAAEPIPTEAERLEAELRALRRRLGIRTFALGAACVLALAAAAVAVVLALGLQSDSATRGDVAAIRDQLDLIGRQAADVSAADVEELSSQVNDLDSALSSSMTEARTSRSELEIAQDDIEELREQVSDLRSQPSGGGGGGGSRGRSN